MQMKSGNIRLPGYIEQLQMRGEYWFSRQAVMQALDMSADTFKVSANRLIKKERIHRIRGDFFVIVPLEHKAVGCLPPNWFIDAYMKSIGLDYYVALLSAAALHGAAHQQPMIFQVMTHERLQPIKAGRLYIQFHYRNKIVQESIETVKTPTSLMNVSNPTMTICDLAKYLDAAGQIHNVATIIKELQDKISMEKLLQHANAGDVPVAVIQRLGYLFEYLALNLDLEALAAFVQSKQPHYRVLVIGDTSQVIEKNKRWRILVNEHVEPDV